MKCDFCGNSKGLFTMGFPIPAGMEAYYQYADSIAKCLCRECHINHIIKKRGDYFGKTIEEARKKYEAEIN